MQTHRTRNRGKREVEREREKEWESRQIKARGQARDGCRAGRGVKARGSRGGSNYGRWRVEAEGSLFEVCGERHQREGRETSRARGDTGRATLCSGPPGPPSPHPTLPHPPALLHPPSCGGLAIGLSHLIMGLGLRVRAWPRCPLGIPRGMSGFWPHLGNRVAFPCGAYSYNLPVSQKTCPGSSQPHFWGPEVGSKQLQLQHSSISPHLPVLGSRIPPALQIPNSRPGRGFQDLGCRGVSQDDLQPSPAPGQQVSWSTAWNHQKTVSAKDFALLPPSSACSRVLHPSQPESPSRGLIHVLHAASHVRSRPVDLCTMGLGILAGPHQGSSPCF